MKLVFQFIFTVLMLCSTSCGDSSTDPLQMENSNNSNVVAVTVSGTNNNFTFQVTIKSPDTGCDQYADWWEVIAIDGQLLYRRILAHSHVNEQPFKRSGGPVAIDENQEVWIRSHMNNTGYGGDVFKGSVKAGFAKQTPPNNFAAALADESPQPTGCAF